MNKRSFLIPLFVLLTAQPVPPPRAFLLAITLLATTSALGAAPGEPAASAQVLAEQDEHDGHVADDGHGHATAEKLAIEAGVIRVVPARSASDDLSGSLSSPSGGMSFRTTSTTSGKATARGATPDRIKATLEVNGALIHHVFDAAQRTVTISTPDPVTVEEADVKLLITFQQEFAHALLTRENFASMPRATEVLWRLSEMYSEAPYGITLERLRVIDLASDPEKYTDIDGLVGGRIKDGAQLKACGQGGNGFIDLHDQGNVCDNGHLWRSEAHDYCSGPGTHHGYLTDSHQDFGCGASGCYGRCGSGCGPLNGQGAWQKDCLDHDKCNRTHGQQFKGCSDEWNEAADDYLNGEIHCIFDHCD